MSGMQDKAIIERRKTGRQTRRSRNQLFPFRRWQPCWVFPEIQSTAFSATRDISTFLKSLWWLAGKESQRRALPLSSKGKIITDCAQTQMTDLLMTDLLVTDPLVTGLQETNLPGKGTKQLSRMKRVQTRIVHVGIGRTHSCLLYFLTWRNCNLRRQQAPEKTVPKKGRTSTFPLRKLLQRRSCPGRQSPDMQKKDALNSAGLGERSESPATDLNDGLRHGKRS